MFLSMFFYKKVIVLYLQSGHSHFPPDVTHAHGKATLKDVNLFHPSQMVELINKASGMKACFTGPDDVNSSCCYIGFEDILDALMLEIPSSKLLLSL